jgi:MoaA/NifB/PqqE/SkfB family radical SAM enzyme
MEKMESLSPLLGDHLLVRQESFGGTLLFVKSGVRTYLSEQEFKMIKKSVFPRDLIVRFGLINAPVITVRPKNLTVGNFSAPDKVFLEVTRICNIRCTHCFNHSGKAMKNELTERQFISVIQDLFQGGVQEIRFTGGEPMMFPGIISLIHYASSLGLYCSLGTNGTMIDDIGAAKLSAAGLRLAVVSLDGLEKKHNSIRGQSSFRSSLNGLGYLNAHGIKTRVNIVVMRKNIDDIPSLVSFLNKRNVHVFMRRYMPIGRILGRNQIVSAREYDKLSKDINSLTVENQGIISGHHIGREGDNSTRIQLPFAYKRCSAGQRGLVVSSDGSVQTCGFLSMLGEKSIGKLPEDSVVDIWDRLNSSRHIETLERNLCLYNGLTENKSQTDCLAIPFLG